MGKGKSGAPTLPPPPKTSGGDGAVGAPSKPCKACSTADLEVTATRDPGAKPLDGVKVDIAGPESRSGTTDKKGKVNFRGIKPSPPDYSVAGSKKNHKEADTTATVPAGKKGKAKLVLTAGELRVTVSDAASAKPIKGAVVRVALSTGGTAIEESTDKAGVAKFVAIDAGSYDIKARHTDYKKPAEKKGVVVAEGTVKSESLALDPIGDITGIVRDKDSKAPIKNAKVTLKERADLSFTTGADGAFKFEDLRAGEYELMARASGYPDGLKKVKVRSNKREKVEIDLKPPHIKIKPKQKEYVVVLDSTGATPAAYPLLQFNITDGPPNFLFDLQLSRGTTSTFPSAPGLAGAWDKAKKPVDRRLQTLFSSWSNGETTLRLDAAGKATYQVPLDWWKDQARLKLDSFTKLDVHYRVVALSDAAGTTKFASAADGAKAPGLEIKNNLVRFRVHKLRYHKDASTPGQRRRFARIEFKVHEAGTTYMYNMVQWKQGGRTDETGTNVWGVTDYGVQHESNYPTWQIDRLRTNPRYWDGTPTVDADKKTAYYEDDVSCGPPDPGKTEANTEIDFQSKMHVDADIPASVTIDAGATTTLADGTTGVYKGVIDEDQAPVLAEKSWSAKMQVSVDAAGKFKFKVL